MMPDPFTHSLTHQTFCVPPLTRHYIRQRKNEAIQLLPSGSLQADVGQILKYNE
jgi:hypothetical protein